MDKAARARLRSALARALALVGVAAIAVAGAIVWFCVTPLTPPRVPFDFNVRTGASLKQVAGQLADQGLLPSRDLFWIVGRARGQQAAIQAGTYRLESPITPLELLDKLAAGDMLPIDIAFIEGTTLQQWLKQLRKHPHVRVTEEGRTEAGIRKALGVIDRALEGLFFPDTYRFLDGTPDIEILRRAHAGMARRLQEAWEARDPSLPLASPYEALVLASIVEKEAARPEERALVASVFVNRLRLGMRLQTDPTVIYGLGERFDGNLRRRDLVADTPFNTYTRAGLPPTPIAMPGAASLAAATRPARTDYLYFVSRGDGSHVFSRTLQADRDGEFEFSFTSPLPVPGTRYDIQMTATKADVTNEARLTLFQRQG